MSLNPLGRAATVLLVGLAASGCVVDGSDVFSIRESLVETRALERGGVFTLENANGTVAVSTWSEPRVRIEAEKAAPYASALKQLQVEIDGEGPRVDVRTRRPVGGWIFGGSGRVDYRVTLPVDARVRIETVNGRIEVEGVSGELRTSTTNGRVEIKEAAGPVVASTVNGSISADYRALPDEGSHRFSATNGSITVAVPEGAGGRLEVRTVNGRIRNDLELESTERSSRRRLEGRLGKGHGSLELSTVNGSVRLRRRSG